MESTAEEKRRLKEQFALYLEEERDRVKADKEKKSLAKKYRVAKHGLKGIPFTGYKGREYIVTESGSHVRMGGELKK